MAAITREVLAEKIYETYDVSKGMARDIVGVVFDTLESAIITGDDVRLHGFGSFRTVERQARQARNPRTGESVQVAAHRAVRFTPAGPLTAALKSTGTKKPARAKK